MASSDTGRWPVLLLPGAVLAVLGWMHRWTSEDAFVDFRVVDHVLAGDGPVFNTGERVEVYASTLWIALLSVVHGVLGFVAIEWTAVVLGLVLSVCGLAAATFGAAMLARAPGRDVLPVGALAFVALPPAWDYATSGLETGLSFGWLGGTFLALVAAHRRPGWAAGKRFRLARHDWVALAAGLGPLIRPGFVVFSLAFVALAIAVRPPVSRRRAARTVAIAAAAPLLLQGLRMGYFGALVPNGAIAEDFARSSWGDGANYAWNTLWEYALLIPLLVLLGWAAAFVRGGRGADRLLVVLPIAAGLVHLLFVVAGGGDLMHGRHLLPGLFAVMLPVAAVGVDRTSAVGVAAAAAVAVWAFVCLAELRPPPPGDADAVREERVDVQSLTGREHPLTVDDHAGRDVVNWARDAERRAERGEVVVLMPQQMPGVYPGRADVPDRTVLSMIDARVSGFAAGTDVRVVDAQGRADPIASRLRAEDRTRARDEKVLGAEWVLARFADPERLREVMPVVDPRIESARHALTCAAMRDVVVATGSPLSVSQFVRNVRFSPRSTSVRWDPGPQEAERELCG